MSSNRAIDVDPFRHNGADPAIGEPRKMTKRAIGLVVAGILASSCAAYAEDALEASNMEIIGHNDLNGYGKGGEGLAIKQYPDGQRILYLAHESAPMCFSALDVTHPEQPTVIRSEERRVGKECRS